MLRHMFHACGRRFPAPSPTTLTISAMVTATVMVVGGAATVMAADGAASAVPAVGAAVANAANAGCSTRAICGWSCCG